MRAWANQIQAFYGQLTINAVAGTNPPLILNANSGQTALTMGDTIVSSYIGFAGPQLNIGNISTHAISFFSNNVARFNISAAGGLFTQTAVGGDQGIGTINATNLFINGVAVGGSATTGSFTGTLVGCTTSPTSTVNWTKIGNSVTLHIQSNTVATSNATSMGMSGLPAGIQPVTIQDVACVGMTNNGTGQLFGTAQVSASGTINFKLAATSGANLTYSITGFTASGTKGIGTCTITYDLN